jgi:hypothetical protein
VRVREDDNKVSLVRELARSTRGYLGVLPSEQLQAAHHYIGLVGVPVDLSLAPGIREGAMDASRHDLVKRSNRCLR